MEKRKKAHILSYQVILNRILKATSWIRFIAESSNKCSIPSGLWVPAPEIKRRTKNTVAKMFWAKRTSVKYRSPIVNSDLSLW